MKIEKTDDGLHIIIDHEVANGDEIPSPSKSCKWHPFTDGLGDFNKLMVSETRTSFFYGMLAALKESTLTINGSELYLETIFDDEVFAAPVTFQKFDRPREVEHPDGSWKAVDLVNVSITYEYADGTIVQVSVPRD